MKRHSLAHSENSECLKRHRFAHSENSESMKRHSFTNSRNLDSASHRLATPSRSSNCIKRDSSCLFHSIERISFIVIGLDDYVTTAPHRRPASRLIVHWDEWNGPWQSGNGRTDQRGRPVTFKSGFDAACLRSVQ